MSLSGNATSRDSIAALRKGNFERHFWRSEKEHANIGYWIQEHFHERLHRGIENRSPGETFLAFAAVPKKET
jgi:hypothetical protein